MYLLIKEEKGRTLGEMPPLVALILFPLVGSLTQ